MNVKNSTINDLLLLEELKESNLLLDAPTLISKSRSR